MPHDPAMALLDLLMPAACAGCGRAGALLCAGCQDAFPPPSRADDRFVAADAGIVIGDTLILAMAAFAYSGAVRKALAALKYTGASRLAPVLSRAAAPTLRDLLTITGPATFVPVPVHVERKRARGYNQAALLATALSRETRVPMAELLVRTRPTTKQHRLDRAGRLRNLRGAFAVAGRPPSTVILVDDIITTTATLETCASVLREAGCEAVYGFAVAREV